MRRKFTVVFLAAVISVCSVLGLCACNDNGVPSTDTAVESAWYANTEFMNSGLASAFGFSSTGQLRLINENWFEIEVAGAAGDMSENPKWAQGPYYFEGEPGKSALHMTCRDNGEVGDEPDYDPANVKMLDADKNEVERGTEVVYHPDENGVYTVYLRLTGALGAIASAGGSVDDATLVFRLKPPQDGSIPDGKAPAMPEDPVNMLYVIIFVPIAVVVLIVALIVTIVLVRKKKKKRACQSVQSEK